jgi:3-dehydro-L-gulonate 2-dehydrogenase
MRIKYEKAYSELLRILYKIGFEDERARLCAKLFIESSLDGIYSHGLNRFSLFIKSIKDGYIDIDAYPEKIEERGLIERWDGKLGPGNLNAYYCMNQDIKNAKKMG